MFGAVVAEDRLNSIESLFKQRKLLCRERNEELTIDGIHVGGLIYLMLRSMQILHSLFSWWCVARVLFGVDLRYVGYHLGLTRAIIHCLT